MVSECAPCKHPQGETTLLFGFLEPFPIPTRVWTYISMDFIEWLLKSRRKIVILFVVNQLSKYSHFCAFVHPYNSSSVAQIFMDQIFHLHGIPSSIISDHNANLTRHFWTKLFHLTSTDGPNGVINKCLKTYLHCFTFEQQHQWENLLPLAEWWYNTSYHITFKMTPYEVVYGQKPPLILPYTPNSSPV